MKEKWAKKLDSRKQKNMTKDKTEKIELDTKLSALKKGLNDIKLLLNDQSENGDELLKIKEKVKGLKNDVREISENLNRYDLEKLYRNMKEVETILSSKEDATKISIKSLQVVTSEIETKEVNVEVDDLVAKLLGSTKEIRVANESSKVFVFDKLYDLKSTLNDVALENLEDCTIIIEGEISALRISKIRNCKLFVGFCTGSTHIQETYDSEIVLSTKQFRLHDSQKLKVFLNIPSTPIIEDCKEIGFGDLAKKVVKNESLSSSFEVKNFETNRWRDVNDFKWLKKVQSPNWYFIE